MNVSHSVGVKISAGPEGCLLSRIATASLSLATSTQLPLTPLRVLLRHATAPRSGAFSVSTSFAVLVVQPRDCSVRVGRVQGRRPELVEHLGVSPHVGRLLQVQRPAMFSMYTNSGSAASGKSITANAPRIPGCAPTLNERVVDECFRLVAAPETGLTGHAGQIGQGKTVSGALDNGESGTEVSPGGDSQPGDCGYGSTRQEAVYSWHGGVSGTTE